MEARKEVWESEASSLSREELMEIKEAEREREITGKRSKCPNPTNERLASLGLTKNRGTQP